jgi:site-specific recombinase XerD
VFQSSLIERGLSDTFIRLHTGALRTFYKFINLSGITRHNPMLLMATRKIPFRIQPVPSLSDITALIAAGHDPFERAVVEVLYATGVRVSEFVNLRAEDSFGMVTGARSG